MKKSMNLSLMTDHWMTAFTRYEKHGRDGMARPEKWSVIPSFSSFTSKNIQAILLTFQYRNGIIKLIIYI